MIVSHIASNRGHSYHTWLNSYHSFSFAGYFNSKMMNFGALRVLNDDIVIGGEGFGKHPHDNMEIVSIPLYGEIAHKDSIGNQQKNITPSEVQIMSAGSGLFHSEYNASQSEDLNFLQIWVLPKLRNIEPRYDQKEFSKEGRKNKIQNIVSPSNPDALWINQDSFFSLCDLDKNKSIEYNLNIENNGLYVFLIEGEIEVLENKLSKRDAIGIYNEGTKFTFNSFIDSQILFIEVPMEIK